MTISRFPHPRITTRTAAGEENGFLVPIFNVHDAVVAAAQSPQQVYLTVVASGAKKGPHLHMKRWGLFTCVKGNVRIVVRTEAGYEEYWSGESHEYATIQVPAGVPAMLVNSGDEPAYVLNMPAPAWQAHDQDDHDVTFDDYREA